MNRTKYLLMVVLIVAMLLVGVGMVLTPSVAPSVAPSYTASTYCAGTPHGTICLPSAVGSHPPG